MQCNRFFIIRNHIINSITAFNTFSPYSIICFAIIQHNAFQVFEEIPFGACDFDCNSITFFQAVCFFNCQRKIFFVYLCIVHFYGFAYIACCINTNGIFANLEAICVNGNREIFFILTIFFCGKLLKISIDKDFFHFIEVVFLCKFQNNRFVLFCALRRYLRGFLSAIGIAMLYIAQQTILQNLLHCVGSIGGCFCACAFCIFCEGQPCRIVIFFCFCIIGSIQITVPFIIGFYFAFIQQRIIAAHVRPIFHNLIRCCRCPAKLIQNKGIYQKVALEQQVCRNHVAAAAIGGGAAAAAAACCVGHSINITRRRLIHCKCLLCRCIFAAGYIEVLDNRFKAIAINRHRISAVIGDIIYTVFHRYIIIQHEQILT